MKDQDCGLEEPTPAYHTSSLILHLSSVVPHPGLFSPTVRVAVPKRDASGRGNSISETGDVALPRRPAKAGFSSKRGLTGLERDIGF
jgi:hypothetical protein